MLLIYIRTLHPTVGGGDSGELVASAYGWGVAHPPGYPLYSILARLFMYLPFGSNPAYRANLFSAICDSGAAVLIAAAVRVHGASLWGGMMGGGLFAFAPLVWAYATVAEVFPLNNLFVGALVLSAVLLEKTREARWGYLIAALCGLGLANHHTFLFYVVGVLPWSFWVLRDSLAIELRWLRLLGTSAAGFIFYLYLPLADLSPPFLSWGNPSTWDGFLKHFFRREYGTLSLGPEFSFGQGGQTWLRVRHFLGAMPAQFLWVGPWIALAGILTAIRSEWRRRRSAGGVQALFAGLVVVYVIVFHTLANLDPGNIMYLQIQGRFWQQVMLLMGVWIGLAVSPFFALIGEAGAGALAIGVIFFQVAVGFDQNDQSRNRFIHIYGRAILDPLPKNSILLSHGDIFSNSIRYLQTCENFRTDVRVFDREMLATPWYGRLIQMHYKDIVLPGKYFRITDPEGYDLGKFMDANAPTHPIAFATFDQYERDRSYEARYGTWPWGFAHRAFPGRTVADLSTYLAETASAFSEFTPEVMKDLARYPGGTWEHLVWREYWEAYYRKGFSFFTQAAASGDSVALYVEAVKVFEDIAGRSREAPPWMYKYLGMSLRNMREKDPTVAADSGTEERMVRWFRRFVELAGDPSSPAASDTEIPALKTWLETYQGRWR